MSMRDNLINYRHGRCSKSYLPADRNIQLNVKAEKNWTEAATRRFIDNLFMQNVQWQEIISQHRQDSQSTRYKMDSVEEYVSRIINTETKTPCSNQDIEIEANKNIIKRKNGIQYHFARVDTLCVKNISEIMLFSDHARAREFLLELDPGYEKLTAITKELGITISASLTKMTSNLLDALTEELISGNIVILIERSTCNNSSN